MRTLLVVSLIVVTAGIAWWARGFWAPAPSADKGRGNIARVVRGRMEQHVKARGIVKAAPGSLVRVGFPMPKDVSRRITSLPFIEGDEVKEGHDLAQLDHDDLKATLEQLLAEAKVIEKRLDALRVLEPLETRLAEGVVAERKAQQQLAQRTRERIAGLYEKKAVPLQDLDQAVGESEAAQAKFAQAEAALDQVRARFRTDIAVLEAQLLQARKAIDNTQVQIGWCTIKAPFSGRVFAVHQRKGELSSNAPSTPVVTLLDTTQLQAHLFVDEVDIGRIALKQDVALRIEAHPGEMLAGKVSLFLPQPVVQENVVYFLAVVEVAAEQRGLLRMEMTVQGNVKAGVKESVLWLPQAALRSRPDGWYVLRPSGDGAREVPVKIGWRDHGRVEIREGLAEGDEVLLEP